MSSFSPLWQSADTGHPDFDVVIHSRVGLSRNLSAYPFAPAITAAQKHELLSELHKKLAGCGFSVFKIPEIPENERSALIDREFLPRAFAVDETSSLALSETDPLWILCMEKDHILVQAHQRGLSLSSAWGFTRKTEEKLGAACDWAFDPDFGYISGDIQRIGTGLSASVLMHLPALELTGFIETACKQAMDAGFSVGGMYGSAGVSGGSLYEMALPTGFMDAEEIALDRLERAAKLLLQYERAARAELLDSSSWELFDFIGRAAGRALHAHSVGWDECAEIVSGIRLGLCIKVLAGMDDAQATDLLYIVRNIRSSRVQNRAKPEHVARADLLRKAVQGLHFSERYSDV